MLKSNSNPSGYDTKYCGSYCNTTNSNCITQEYTPIKSNIENKIENKIENINQYDDISLLKIEYIVEVIRRKLNILHRITKNKVLKSKNICDSVVIEREIEKRATLSIVDMLTLLKIADKDKVMTTQQRVVLLSEINKNSKLTIDEKITIVNRVIAMDIVKDNPSKKHLINKLILLFIVKKSGFSIDETKSKGYKPVMQSVEEPAVVIQNSDNTKISEKVQEDNLATELIEDSVGDDKSSENFIDTQNVNKNTLASEELQKDNLKDKLTNDIIYNEYSESDSVRTQTVDNKLTIQQAKKSIEIPKVTKTFVHSKRHFKFGAGFVAKNNTVSLLLPSGYILDDSNVAYQPNNLRINKNTNNNAIYINSPLYISFTKNKKSADYTLFDFFNSNIIQCKSENLKYRQTVISKSPAVLKHKLGANIYTASVFIKKLNCVYDIKFKFKKTIANKASTVNRILASVKFEGM